MFYTRIEDLLRMDLTYVMQSYSDIALDQFDIALDQFDAVRIGVKDEEELLPYMSGVHKGFMVTLTNSSERGYVSDVFNYLVDYMYGDEEQKAYADSFFKMLIERKINETTRKSDYTILHYFKNIPNSDVAFDKYINDEPLNGNDIHSLLASDAMSVYNSYLDGDTNRDSALCYYDTQVDGITPCYRDALMDLSPIYKTHFRNLFTTGLPYEEAIQFFEKA